jgi:dihydroorotate dehydrogenase electron transfer subunit
MEIRAGAVAEAARPGQFVHVRCLESLEPLLRRPISICSVDRQEEKVTLLYRVVGRGTGLLAVKRPGEAVSLLGPLGRGFTLPGEEPQRAVPCPSPVISPRAQVPVAAVGGGIGVAPLFFLLEELARRDCHGIVYIGAASAGQLLLVNEIKALGHDVQTATDDGSDGFRGFITDLFEENLKQRPEGQRSIVGKSDTNQIEKFNMKPEPDGRSLPGFVYACGPAPMMRRVSGLASACGIPCEVSLEERMGCGVGACLSCACKIQDREGAVRYRRVCIDGPVFPAEEVVWL